MFAETFTITDKVSQNNRCKIQVGIAPGIPYISFFGDSSTVYNRTREKIPFIFSYIGRKLPKRKIKVNFSTNKGQVKGSHVDLAVLSAIYLALNDTGIEREVYCFGEVDMNGEVKMISGLENMLWSYRNISDDNLIFVPKGDTQLLNLYDDLSPIPISHISEVFKFFEGTWEPERAVKTRISKKKPSNLSISPKFFPSILSESSSILIDFYQYQIEEYLEAIPQLDVNRSNDTGQKINSLITAWSEKRSLKRNFNHLLIDGKEELLFIITDKEILKSTSDLTTLIQNVNFCELSTRELEDLGDFLTKNKTILCTSLCKCNRVKGKCICTTRELHNYRSALYEICQVVEYILTSDLEEDEGKITIDNTNSDLLDEKQLSKIHNKLMVEKEDFLGSL